MEDFPSNSKNQQQAKQAPSREDKNIQPVVSGEVTRRKKPVGKRFKEFFFGGEDVKSIWSYVAMDVLVPYTKDAIFDGGRLALERALYKDGAGRHHRSGFRGPSNNSNYAYTSYNRVSSSPTRDAPFRADPRKDSRPISQKARAGHNFDEIVIQDKGEAEFVIDQLFALVDQYQVASVSDLYALVGITANYTDDKYGWTDLRGAGASRLRGGGYLLDLPKPELIN